jgi:hypothetical protein
VSRPPPAKGLPLSDLNGSEINVGRVEPPGEGDLPNRNGPVRRRRLGVGDLPGRYRTAAHQPPAATGDGCAYPSSAYVTCSVPVRSTRAVSPAFTRTVGPVVSSFSLIIAESTRIIYRPGLGTSRVATPTSSVVPVIL